MYLPRDSFVAGEIFEAQARFQNLSPEMVQITEPRLAMTGGETVTDGFSSGGTCGWGCPTPFAGSIRVAPGASSFGRTLLHVLPEVSTETVEYGVRMHVHVWRQVAPPGTTLAWEAGQDLEVGPVPLHVLSPTAAQQLHGTLETDTQGWRLRATDELGRTPTTPIFGGWLVFRRTGLGIGRFGPGADGTWSAAWPGDDPVTWVWVDAPGYASTKLVHSAAGS